MWYTKRTQRVCARSAKGGEADEGHFKSCYITLPVGALGAHGGILQRLHKCDHRTKFA